MTLLLPNWNGVAYNDRVICIMADSTGEFDTGTTADNTYPMLIREKMRAAWGIDGTGFLGTWRDEWAFSATGWTGSVATNLFGQGPYIQSLQPYGNTQTGVGSTAVATFTLPSWLRQAAISVVLYMVDGVSSNNFSFSVDGGAWTDTTATWTQNSKMKRVNLAVTPASTIAVRAATAAGTSRTIYLSAIEIKTSLDGATLHDVSSSGDSLSSTAYNNQAGGLADAMGFLDLLQPLATVVSYTNDLDPTLYDIDRIGTDLDYIVTRSTYGIVIPMMFWGQDRTNAATTFPATATVYNSKATSSAYIDLFGRYGAYAAVAALGYMADTLHPNDAGSRVIADVLWRILSRGDNAYRIRSSP